MIARPSNASDDWTAEDWEARRARAAAYLATDPKWVVGPAVVEMYRVGWERAQVREEDGAAQGS